MREIVFFLNIDNESKVAKQTQIYNFIKNEILNGNYKANQRLPSIRKACDILSVSKSCVINAYTHLSTEGYVENLPRKGYIICKINNITKENHTENYELNFKQDHIYYINDGIDRDSFSKSLWKKYYSNVLMSKDATFTDLGDEQGESELRQAICNFIKKHRGCNLTSAQVIIGSGVQNLIEMLIRITREDYRTVALEYPGYKKVRYIFEDFGYKIENIPVSDDGICIKSLKKLSKTIVYTSPAYQYPLGNIMSIQTRNDIINFANSTKSLIIEDDYANIIRYDGLKIPALQGLDKFDNTVYLGSFSKTFLPSLRISFMVIPQKYLMSYYNIKAKYTHTTSKIEQLALAKFINDGEMERHLRKINNLYKTKNQIITSYVKKKYADRLFIKNNDSGFHIVFQCKTDFVDLEAFKDEFLLIDVISFENNQLSFLFSYSGLIDEEICNVIDKIVEILKI